MSLKRLLFTGAFALTCALAIATTVVLLTRDPKPHPVHPGSPGVTRDTPAEDGGPPVLPR